MGSVDDLPDFDPCQIKSNDWRQFSVLNNEDFKALCVEASKDDLVVLVSHSCDIRNTNRHLERHIECIHFRKIDNANGLYTGGRNPRILHISIEEEGHITNYEAQIGAKIPIERGALASIKPSSLDIGNDNKKIIVNWIANRYKRLALPDTFNERLRANEKKIRRIVKKPSLRHINIHIAINSWNELNDGESYLVELIGIADDTLTKGTREFDDAQTALGQFAACFNECTGIEVSDHELRTEREITLADLRFIFPMDFDYLSLTDDESGEIPLKP